MSLIGISLTSDELAKAVELSSIEQMKKSENAHMSTYLVRNQEVAFVRKAKATLGSELLVEDKRYIEELTKATWLKLTT